MFEITPSDRILGEIANKLGINPIIKLVSTPGITFKMNYEDLGGFLVIFLNNSDTKLDPVAFNIDFAYFKCVSEVDDIYEIGQDNSNLEPFRFKVIEKDL